ncbi:transporter [soil metagenome]
MGASGLGETRAAAARASNYYGADASGLICGYLFDDQGGSPAHALDADEAASWLAIDAESPSESGGTFLWLHFNLSHAPAERWIREHARLPDSFFEALKDGSHSTRIERDDDTLIAIVNDVHFEFGFEPSDIATLWISVDSRLVVTGRTQPLRSVDALRVAVRDGQSLRSSVALLEQLLRKQADGLVSIVRDVTSRIDDIEDNLLAGRLDHKRARLGTLRRLLVRLQRLLAPEPAALFRLLQHPPMWMAHDDVEELRASTEEFSAVLRDMLVLQERIKLLQEEIAASVDEGNSRSLFVLTVVTVLALPINILAGLFGMNVGGVPLAESRNGFWIVVSIVLAFTAVACWVAFRKKD